jgi:aryl-alcohol dehydrogenase-like predicted oxidoreductase
VLSGSSPLVGAQAEYSLLDRSTEDSLVPALAAHGLGFLAWAPLGRGVLTGKYRHGTPSDSRGASPHFTRYVGRHRTEQAARVVEAVATAAEGLGTTPLAVACAWVLDRPSVTSVVVGARDRAQLIGSLGAEQVVLPAEIRSALDDVSGA